MKKEEKKDVLSIEHAVKFIKKNRTTIITVLVVILVAVAAFCGYEAYQNKKYQNEWGGLFLAELNFVTDSESSTTALEQFTEKNKSTQAGTYAALNLGNAYFQMGDFPKAELYYKQVMASKYKDLANMAEVSLIATLVAQKLNETAINQANSFIAKNPTHFAVGQVSQHRALAQDQAGQKEEAKASYKKITEDYPGTYYAAFAELRLKDIK